MAYLSRRRDELEVIRSILEAASNELSLTRTAMHSGSNYKHVWRIILVLQEKGLIKVKRASKKKHIVLTQKGQVLCKLLDGLQYCLYSLESCNSNNPEFSDRDLAERAFSIVEYILAKKRRSRMEIYYIILVSLLDSTRTVSSIANKCYLNVEQARQYIEELKCSNLVEEFESTTSRKMYSITSRGLQLINLYIKIYDLIYGAEDSKIQED